MTAASELAAQDEQAPAQAAIAFEPLLTLDAAPSLEDGAANEPHAAEPVTVVPEHTESVEAPAAGRVGRVGRRGAGRRA